MNNLAQIIGEELAKIATNAPRSVKWNSPPKEIEMKLYIKILRRLKII